MIAPGLARLFGRRLPALAGVTFAAALAVALAGRGDLLRWLAAALAIACAPAAVAAARAALAAIPAPPRLRALAGRLAGALPWLALAALALGLLGELALGRPPATRDHAIHYFHTQVAVDALREHGRLVGLSDRLGQGYAFGDNYPFLPYLWTGAAHLLTLGLVPLRASYALGILAMWGLMVAAIAWLTRLAAGQLLGPGRRPLAAWAGALAAGLWLVDPGASREGGWHYLMFHGVWPQLLATALWTLSLPLTWGALRRPSPRRLALAALALGGALLAHPFALMTAAASALAWLLVIAVVYVPSDMSKATGPSGQDPEDSQGSAPRLAPGALRGWALIHLGAGLLAAGWLAAFLGSADTLGRSPVPWRGLGEAVTDLVAGELFTHSRALVGPLALLGLALALRRPRPLALLGLALLVGLLVLASDAAVAVLRLDLVISAVKNLQFPRYAIAIKPLLFAFAGIGGAVALRAALRRDPAGPASPRARLVAAALLGPLAIALVDDAGRLLARPVAGLGTLEGSRHRAVDRQLGEHLRAEAAREAAAGRRLRVAFLRQGMGGGLFPIFAITDAGAGLVLDGHVPTINSIHRIERRSPAALRALGVTHVLHDRPLGAAEAPLARELEAIAQVGPYTLARLAPAPTPRRLPGEVAWAAAAGEVQRLAGDDPHVRRYAVRGLGGADLELVALPHRKWQATFEPAGGGEALALPLTPRSQAAGAFTGQRLRVPGDGVVALRFVAPPAEARAGLLSLVALALALAALAFGRPLVARRRLRGRARAAAAGLGGVALLVVLALAWRRQEAQLAETWRRGPGWSGERRLVRELADLAVAAVRLRPRDPCDGLDGRDPHPGCSAALYAPRRSMLYQAPYLYRCVAVTIPPHGDVALALALRAGERVRGILAVDGDPKPLRWEIAGVRPRQALPGKKVAFEVDAPGDRLELTLSSSDRRPRAVCVAAAVVDGP